MQGIFLSPPKHTKSKAFIIYLLILHRYIQEQKLRTIPKNKEIYVQVTDISQHMSTE